jgi:hypothetical protein
MAFYVNDSVFCDIYLNDVQLSLSLGNVQNLNITENIYSILPALRLVIEDSRNSFGSGMLNAGSKISIKVGNNQDTAARKTYDFIVQGVPEHTENQAVKTYRIYGVLDKLKYQKCMEPFFYTGTSSNALKSLCKQCNLKYDGVYTFDEMTWCNGTKDYASFAQNVINHGYVDRNSCMVGLVTLDGKLLYRNVNNLFPKYTFSNSKTVLQDSFVFLSMDEKNNSGLYNLEYGYKNQLSQYGYEDNHLIDSLTVTKFGSNVFNLSKTLLDDIGYIRNKIINPDIGNYHKNWAQAEYQNLRNRALFSLQEEFTFYGQVGLDLLQKVNISYTDPQSKQTDTSKPSECVLIGKTLAITNGQYYEKYTGVSTGTNNSLFGNLV